MKKQESKIIKKTKSTLTKKGPTTTKKMKVVGTQNYLNQETGELTEMQVIKLEDRDFNFDKIWLFHILEALDLVGGGKMKVMTTLLKLKRKDNMVLATQQEISDLSEMSKPIVNQTLKLLISSNFLQKIRNGAYFINPEMLFNGGKNSRLNVLIEYNNAKDKIKETQVAENPDTFIQSEEE